VTQDFAHKGLHPRNTQRYKKAEDEETRLLEREIKIGRMEIRKQEEEAEKLRAELKKREKDTTFFKNLAHDHQAKIEHLEAIRRKLDVQKREHEKLSDSHIAKFETMVTHQFATMKQLNGGLKDGVILTVSSEAGGSGFSLQHFFDGLYAKKSGDARIVLFDDETGSKKVTTRILSEWKISYDKKEECENTAEARAKKKEDTGVDEGGPSRQFITDVFKQVDMLSIQVGGESVKLFENTPRGAVVKTDDSLNQNISNFAKAYVTDKAAKGYVADPINRAKEQEKIVKVSIKQAKDYSRAIGRIMLHSFVHKQTLPSNAMPPFIMNVMLHGYDNDYHKDDILKDIDSMLDGKGNVMLGWLLEEDCEERDENGNEWTRDSIFEKYIPTTFIRTRKILLGSLRDGLTFFGSEQDASDDLEKGCGLSRTLAMVPMEAIHHIYFAKPDISVEDLWGVLKPKYGEGEPDVAWGMSEKDKERHKKEQEIFFNGGFKKYLEESAKEDQSFLDKFLEFATGSNFLPYDKEFKINIEFNFSLDPVGYPNSHACTFDVVMPGVDSFFSDYKSFKEDKMNFVIGEVYNQFHMN